MTATYGHIAPVFVQNRGQWRADVQYRTLLSGSVATLTSDGLVLTQVAGRDRDTGLPLRGHSVRLRFVDARTGASGAHVWTGSERAPTHASWFRGKDPACWISDAPCWTSVRLADVVPGVSVEVHGRNGVLEYDLAAEPGVSVDNLDVVVEGVDALVALSDGTLEIRTPLGSIRQSALRSREIPPGGESRDLPSRVVLRGAARFGFIVDSHDPARPLVVDPQITYGTFVEGSGTDEGYAITTDACGAAIVAGTSASPDFPTTPGAFDPDTIDWAGDAVVFKLDPSGTGLEFATFLGGNGIGTNDGPCGVHVDASGVVTVAGTTASPDFPVTSGAFQSSLLGIIDPYVTRLNPTGTALVFSTLYGGSSNDWAADMAVDAQGRIVIGGGTYSHDLPTTGNALFPAWTTCPTCSSAFVARLSADGSAVDYASYFGGLGEDRIDGVAVDPQSAFYIGGRTDTAYPCLVTPGAFQTTPAGYAEAFVAKFQPDGQVAWSTLLGGKDDEFVYALDVDAWGQPILGGYTRSFDYPSTPDSFDPIPNGGLTDAFLTKLTADGSGLLWSGFLGGSETDEVHEIAVEPSGACVVTGQPSANWFPITPDAVTAGVVGKGMFVTRITASGHQISFSTKLGGNDKPSTAWGVAVDPQGAAYLTGYTLDPGFPTTEGSFDETLSGSTGLFVLKLDFSPWSDQGAGLPGTCGSAPHLAGTGTLQPASAGDLALTGARPLAPTFLVTGLAPLELPFKGGVLVPVPYVTLPLVTDASGDLDLAWAVWPSGLPPGLLLLFQAWVQDPTGPVGWAASNGLRAILPVVLTDP